MTVKLYENHSYLQEFTATVLSCTPAEEYFDVVLTQTAFFPEGGGQAADTGRLDTVEVVDVQIENGVIKHKTRAALAVGATVCGQIDWELRFSRMQNHSGEHIVSGLLYSYYGYTNVGFHMGQDMMTIDVNGKLTAADMEKIEQLANQAVYENRAVTVAYPTPEEAAHLQYRSKLDIQEGLRIVTIDGYDCCACCAPHVARTGEIGVIKILTFYPHKGGTRIELICGKPAFADYCMLQKQTQSIMRQLSAKREETDAAVQRLAEALTAEKNEKKSLREKLIWLQLETIPAADSVAGFVPEGDYEELRYCANRLQKQYTGVCMLFAGTAAETEFLYVISSSTGSVKPLTAELNRCLNGRGGGKDRFAQGKVGASRAEIEAFLRNQAKKE